MQDMPTGKAQTARWIAMLISWCISFGGPLSAVLAGASQVTVIALFFGGMLPYIFTIQIIEPWLEKRSK
jgi:hypothetical protein